MRVNIDSDELQATANDPRKTKIGDFIRKASIDELPQFINVLLGQMSVVGPRPHMLKHTEEYSRLIDKYMVRHLIRIMLLSILVYSSLVPADYRFNGSSVLQVNRCDRTNGFPIYIQNFICYGII